MDSKHHISHRKKRSHRRIKRGERKVLLIAAPITIATALVISFAITGIPKLYHTIYRNVTQDIIIDREKILGSAVRNETDIKKGYEKKYRENTKDGWKKGYEEILQNTNPDKIKELEKKHKKLKKLEKH